MSKNYTNIQKLDNITGSIDDNSDVELSGLIDGQFLKYSAESGAWLPSSSGDFVSLSINGTGLSVVGHNHSIGDISGLQSILDTKQATGNYSIVGHTHTTADITGFNSGVSGLLPVVNILAGSGISVLSNSSTFTISVTGTFGLTSEEVDDRVAELLQPGTGISLDYNDDLNILTINTIGLQPSGNYSVVGHSHIISDISGLQNALDNKQPTGVYAPLDSPIFTGTPIVPTATTGTNTNQIASTAFVRTEISNLVNSAPETLDTLQELANALGNDNNFSTTITSGLANKASLNGANFTGSISSPTGIFNALVVNDYTFPTQDGFADQYLQTDGAGNVSWVTIAGGNDIVTGTGISGYLSKWNSSDTLTSGIIYDNGSNIGIGTSSPSSRLEVSGVISATSGNSTNWNTAYSWGNHSSVGYLTDISSQNIQDLNNVENSFSDPLLLNENILIYDSGISQFKGSTINLGLIRQGSIPLTGYNTSYLGYYIRMNNGEFTVNEQGANLDFRVEGDSNANLLFTDASTDRVGIGTSTPSSKLQIVGDGGTTDSGILTISDPNGGSTTSWIKLYADDGFDDLTWHIAYSDTTMFKTLEFRTSLFDNVPEVNIEPSGEFWVFKDKSVMTHRYFASDYLTNFNTASRPSYTWLNDEDTGLFSPTGNAIGFSAGGIERMRIDTNQVVVNSGNIIFNDVGGNFDFRVEGDTDTNLLFTDASTDRVGIGTSSPSSKLHVNGPITVAAGSAGAPSFTFADDSDIGVYRAGVNSLAFSTSGVERIRIGPDGEVGIGMTGSSTIGLRILHDANANNIVGSVLNVQMPASALTSYGYWTAPSLLSENTAYTTHIHYIANPISSIPSGSSAGTEVGFQFGNSIQQHTVRGFASFLNTLTGYERYAFLAGGTAPSLFNGVVWFANGSNSAPSIAFSSDTDTGLFYPTANNLAITTGGTERLRIDSSGKILVGTTTSRTAGPAVHPAFQFEGTNAGSASFQCIAGSAQATVSPQIILARHRGAVGASSLVQDGDTIGIIRFNGGDDTDCISNAAVIECRIDGTPGSNDMPGVLIFSTTADGSATSTERMRITSAGNVGVGTNSPTERLDINSDAIRIRTAQTPASATAAGNTGDICWDSNYLYVCVATNTWKRSALSTWP